MSQLESKKGSTLRRASVDAERSRKRERVAKVPPRT